MRRFRFILAAFIVCCLPFYSVTAKAESFTLHYAMYTGGFQAMTVNMDFTFAKDEYRSELTAKPYGFLGHFLPWAGEYSVSGITHDAVYYPQSHIKISRWRDDMDRYAMTYRDRQLASVEKLETEDGKTAKENMRLDPALTKDSVDIMTAAIRVMQNLHNGKDCATSSVVFDGKRRFRLQFTQKGKEKLTASRYNIFSGDAVICDVEMVPLLGYKKKPQGYYKIQEASRARGHLPRIWFGSAWTNGRPVPVKMLVKSEFGAVFVHLQKVTQQK